MIANGNAAEPDTHAGATADLELTFNTDHSAGPINRNHRIADCHKKCPEAHARDP